MRKTFLLTAVIILVAGITFSWAGKEAGKGIPTDELISNKAPDHVLQAKISAEEAELARKEALFAAQPKRKGVSASNVDPNPSAKFSNREKQANKAEALKSRGELPVILDTRDVSCPAGAIAEGEGCGNNINSGCWTIPPVFSSIDCGDTICGSAWVDNDLMDYDWYRIDIYEPRFVTITACADFDFVVGSTFLNRPGDCDDVSSINPYAYGEAGDTVSVIAIRPSFPGWAAYAIVVPQSPLMSPCEQGDTTYWVSVTCETTDPGACCYGYPDTPTCEDLSHADCYAINGYEVLWTEGTECATFECPPAVANDLCVNAQAVSIPSSTPGTTNSATGDNTEFCGEGGSRLPGVWYSVIGTGREVTASTCNSDTDWDTKIQVWCNNCDYPVCVGGNDDDCDDFFRYSSSFTWCAEDDVEYLILVYPYESTDGGDFTLDIERGHRCSNPPDCDPPLGACCYGDRLNPSCENATEEECDTQHTDVLSWVEGALCSDDPTPCPPACTIECPQNSIAEAEACGLDSNDGCNADPYPSYPGSFEQIACGDTICGTTWANGTSRDTDWYAFTTDTSQVITVNAVAEFPLRVIFFYQIDTDDCADIAFVYQDVNECDTVTIEYEVPGAGEYWVWIGPPSWTLDIPCDETGEYFIHYWFTVTSEDPPLGACCNDETSVCHDDVAELFCQEPLRWTVNTLCADLPRECGFVACEDAIYSNGDPIPPTSFIQVLAQCDPWRLPPYMPFNAASVDDFELVGTDSVTITGIAAWFMNWNPDTLDTPPQYYAGINVTIYATDPSDGAPGGEPLDSAHYNCAHQDNMGGDGIIATVYIEQGAFTYTDQSAIFGFDGSGYASNCWKLELPVNITVNANTQYWLEVQPVLSYSDYCQSGWLLSAEHQGDYAMFLGATWWYLDWTSMGVDHAFCLFADQIPLSGDIAGTVTDVFSRAPVEGAEVNLWQGGGIVAADSTASDGTYLFANLELGLYDVEFIADGYFDVTETDVEVLGDQVTTVDMVLHKPGYYSGVVSDFYGTPLEGVSVDAAVQAMAMSIGEKTSVDDTPVILDVDPVLSVVTDEFGQYTLILEPGTYDITYAITDWDTQVGTGIVIALDDILADNDVTLRRTGTLTGTVDDGTDPIEGVLVTVEGVDTDLTDALGDYSIGGIYDGDYNVTFSHVDYDEVAYVDHHINENPPENLLDVSMGVLYGDIAGTVTDVFSRVPVEGAEVNLWQGGGIVAADSTASDGTYLFANLELGLYDVEFIAEGYFDVTETDVEVLGGQATTVDMVLHKPGYYSGVVSDFYGTPLEGVSVDAAVQAMTMSIGRKASVDDTPVILDVDPVLSVVTDEFGQYTLILEPGTYDITYSMTDWDTQVGTGKVIALDDILADNDVTLRRTGTLTGTVDDVTDPIEGVLVTVEGVDTDLTDEFGGYSIGGIYDGDYNITFSHVDYDEVAYVDHHIYENPPANVLDVSMESGFHQYLPGDINMSAGTWPSAATGPDVTYLVNYFRGVETSHSCLLDGFWCSADANGDCNIIGSDVTKLVNVFRGEGSILYCEDYPPAWPTPADLPAEAPSGWPNCEE